MCVAALRPQVPHRPDEETFCVLPVRFHRSRAPHQPTLFGSHQRTCMSPRGTWAACPSPYSTFVPPRGFFTCCGCRSTHFSFACGEPGNCWTTSVMIATLDEPFSENLM